MISHVSFTKLCLILASFSVSFSMSGKTGRELIQENGLKSSVAPMLTTHWSQDGGENSMLPFVNVEQTRRAVAGCGAVALAQVLNYWKYPAHGMGENYYYWKEIDELAQYLYADFQNTYYDWDNMASVYKSNTSVTQLQTDAVSTLMAQIGVALEMKYKYNSTATQIEYILAALRTYFGYNPNMRLVRYINGAYTMDEWLTMIYQELSEGRPVLMGGRYQSANHIFVADGYDEEGRVHLNLGKANLPNLSSFNKDTYYDLTQEGVTYNADMRMILGITPEALETEMMTVNVAAPGTLKEAMGGENESRKVCRLKVTGIINSEDFAWLSTLSDITTGQLTHIDLSQCNTVEHTIPAGTFKECYTLQEIILPDDVTHIEQQAFYSCRGLCAVTLPKQLEQLGYCAFADCRYLKEIHLPASLNSMDQSNHPFEGTQLERFSIDSENLHYKIENNALIGIKDKTLYCMPMEGCIEEYIVPEGVERVMSSALSIPYLQKLSFPSSIQRIDLQSLGNCTDVFCYTSTAPQMNTFCSSYVKRLHVPKGCADVYKMSGWAKWFADILDDLPADTGIHGVDGSPYDNVLLKHYNLSGVEVHDLLPNRLYIQQDSKGKTQKVMWK